MIDLPRRARLALPALVAAVVALAGCTSPAPSSGSSSPAATPTAAPAASPAVVPLTAETEGGVPRLVVEISLGGSAPFPVVLDTGSTGLFVESAALAGASVTSTSTSFSEHYVDSELTGTLAHAPLQIGSVASATDVTFGVVEGGSDGVFAGVSGILGVAPADGDWQSTGLYSPLLQLAAPANGGFAIDVPASGAGTLALGQPIAGASSITTPLTPLSPAPTVSAGVGVYVKDVALCWTIAGAAPACGPTDLDTGAPTGLLNSTVVTGLPTGAGGDVAAGVSLAVATPTGQPLWSVTTGATAGVDAFAVASLGSATDYNTGLAFYSAYVVGFDWTAGRLVLTPKS